MKYLSPSARPTPPASAHPPSLARSRLRSPAAASASPTSPPSPAAALARAPLGRGRAEDASPGARRGATPGTTAPRDERIEPGSPPPARAPFPFPVPGSPRSSSSASIRRRRASSSAKNLARRVAAGGRGPLVPRPSSLVPRPESPSRRRRARDLDREGSTPTEVCALRLRLRPRTRVEDLHRRGPGSSSSLPGSTSTNASSSSSDDAPTGSRLDPGGRLGDDFAVVVARVVSLSRTSRRRACSRSCHRTAISVGDAGGSRARGASPPEG